MSERAGSREDLGEERPTSKELSRGVEAKEGSDGEEERNRCQLRAGNPRFVSNRKGENHKNHREQEVSENTNTWKTFIIQEHRKFLQISVYSSVICTVYFTTPFLTHIA